MNKLIFLFFSISFSAVFAQNSKRVFEKVEILENHTLKITVNDGIYKIVPYTNNIIETTFIPYGEDENKKSHAVILKPGNIENSFKEDVNEIILKTEGVIVKVKKSPFQINYYYKNKFLISYEYEANILHTIYNLIVLLEYKILKKSMIATS